MTYWLAEVGSNHNRDLDRALAFVDEAAAMCCDGVKFQLFRASDLYVNPPPGLSDRELPPEFIAPIASRCAKRGIDFVCSPFSLDAVAMLQPHVAVYKVSSFDILRLDLLAAIAATGKPVFLSAGSATVAEIRAALDVLDASDATLLHCVSVYPCPPHLANLSRVSMLRGEFGVDCGYSDHTADPLVVARAAHQWRASVVEFHLDLDGTGAEYGHGHCFLPGAMRAVIVVCDDSAYADGPAPDPGDPDERADPSDGKRPRMCKR